jgi:hypothetical protein
MKIIAIAAIPLLLAGCAIEHAAVLPAQINPPDARLMRPASCPPPVSAGADARSELAATRRVCSADADRFTDLQTWASTVTSQPAVVASAKP